MIYFFKKTNGDVVQAEINQAYEYIYENKNMREPLFYIGRSNGDIIKNGVTKIQEAIEILKKELLTPELTKIIEQSRAMGAFSPQELEFTQKIRELENKMYKELEEEELATVEKVYPDKTSNIATPSASGEMRNKILKEF